MWIDIEFESPDDGELVEVRLNRYKIVRLTYYDDVRRMGSHWVRVTARKETPIYAPIIKWRRIQDCVTV